MKRTGLLFCIAITFILRGGLRSAAQNVPIVIPDSLLGKPIKQPRMELHEREHHFGKFYAQEDSVHRHVFTFTNTGQKDLVVVHAIGGCGCTQPSFSKEPVKPGATGRVTVTFKATGMKPGFFRKSVTVFSNDPRSYLRLYVCGEILE